MRCAPQEPGRPVVGEFNLHRLAAWASHAEWLVLLLLDSTCSHENTAVTLQRYYWSNWRKQRPQLQQPAARRVTKDPSGKCDQPLGDSDPHLKMRRCKALLHWRHFSRDLLQHHVASCFQRNQKDFESWLRLEGHNDVVPAQIGLRSSWTIVNSKWTGLRIVKPFLFLIIRRSLTVLATMGMLPKTVAAAMPSRFSRHSMSSKKRVNWEKTSASPSNANPPMILRWTNKVCSWMIPKDLTMNDVMVRLLFGCSKCRATLVKCYRNGSQPCWWHLPTPSSWSLAPKPRSSWSFGTQPSWSSAWYLLRQATRSSNRRQKQHQKYPKIIETGQEHYFGLSKHVKENGSHRDCLGRFTSLASSPNDLVRLLRFGIGLFLHDVIVHFDLPERQNARKRSTINPL